MDEAPILVVDDDAVSRHVLSQALKDAAFPHEVARSGTEALAWLASHTPRVVLLDLLMPPPDGYTVLRQLRMDERTREVPVVVLTALDADDDVTRAFELGADDFVRKPFRPAELIARIHSQLRMREYVDALGRRERDSKVVLELTQALSSTLDFRDILFTVVRRIAEVARVDRCSIVLVREQGAVGYVVAASDDKDLRDLPIDLTAYPEIQEVMQTGLPLVVEDAATHPLFDMVRSGLPENSFRSLALLPILFEDRPMGALFLRGRQPIAFKEHELSLARTVANATAIALRNARILQSLKDRTQEITFARFEAEKRLKTLQRYADFFHSSADGIMVLDDESRVLFSNPRAQEITGRTEEDLANERVLDIISAADRGRLSNAVRKFDGRPDAKTMDLGVERHGKPRILSVSLGVVPLEESGGAVLMSFRDVTDDRATEAELQKTKEFLERVIESSVDAIISANLQGSVLLFNGAAERCYGYVAEEVVGRMNVRELYPGGRARRIMALIQSPDHGGPGRLESYRTEVLAKDGTRIPVLLSAALILQDGRPVGSVGVFTDLRELMRMESKLNEAQEELRSREKTALIAELAGAAAHELNQPLTSVMGYAELVKKKAQSLNGDLNKETQIIIDEAERMAEIVRKIGKITKYETKSYVGAAKIIDLDRSSDQPQIHHQAPPGGSPSQDSLQQPSPLPTDEVTASADDRSSPDDRV